MTKTIEILVCDKCGKEITGGYLPIDYKDRHYDLCEDCADAMLVPKSTEGQIYAEGQADAGGVKTCCAPARESGVTLEDMPEKYMGG